MKKPTISSRTHPAPLGGLLVFFLLGGCAAPSVNLATNEPIKVDITMRLDVYQYGQTGGTKPAETPANSSQAAANPKAARDNRLADIQQFKINQLVGEGRDGLLVVRWEEVNKQPEADRISVRDTVKKENADRMEMMKAAAAEEKISLPEIQAKHAEIWRNRAFKGEWIEMPLPDGGDGQWVRKDG